MTAPDRDGALPGFDLVVYQKGTEPRWLRKCQACGRSCDTPQARVAYEWALGHAGSCKGKPA